MRKIISTTILFLFLLRIVNAQIPTSLMPWYNGSCSSAFPSTPASWCTPIGGLGQNIGTQSTTVDYCMGSSSGNNNVTTFDAYQIANARLMETTCAPEVGSNSPADGFEMWEDARANVTNSTYNGYAPAEAGFWNVAAKIRVKWKKPGVYRLSQKWCGTTYPVSQTDCINTEWRSIIVTVGQPASVVNAADFTLSAMNDCPSPYTAFTINRSNPSHPIKRFYLDITQCDINGVNISGGQWWQQNNNGTASSGWAEGNMTSHTPALPSNFFVAGRYYRVGLAVATGCSGWVTSATKQVFRVKTGGVPVITGTVSADSYANTNGTTIATRLRRCAALAITFSNTTGYNSCNTTTMSFAVQKYTDVTYATVSGGATSVVLPYASSYILSSSAISTAINAKGYYKVTIKGTNNYGISTTNKTYFVQTIDLINDDAKFKFTISNTVKAAAGYTSNTIDPFVTAQPVSVGPGLTAISFNSFQDEYIEDFKVEVFQKDITVSGAVWTLITEPGLSFCNPYPNRPGPACATTNVVYFAEQYMGLPNQPKVQDYFKTITLASLPNQLFFVRITAKNKCITTAIKESQFKVIRPNGCSVCRTTNNSVVDIQDEAGTINDLSITANPNPATNLLQFGFELNEADDNVSITVTDMAGRMIKQVITNQKYDKGNYNYDWAIPSELANGLYLYTLRTSKGVKTGKFIKQ